MNQAEIPSHFDLLGSVGKLEAAPDGGGTGDAAGVMNGCLKAWVQLRRFAGS